MTAFVFFAALLVVGALLLVVPPMLGIGQRRRRQAARQRQAETALVVLREQLAELEAERVAGRISDVEYQRTREEIEQRALEEGGSADHGSDTRPAALWAGGLTVGVTLAAVAIYLILGEPAALDPEARVARDPDHEVTAEQMAGLVVQLADRLEREPQDVTGWLMLARSYLMLRDVTGAAATWARIGASVPEHADVLADWADLLISAQGGSFEGEPRRLLDKAIELEPYHIKARALAGTADFQSGDFAAASRHWEQVLVQVRVGEDNYAAVLESINEARTRGGLPLLEAGSAPSAPAPAVEAAQTPLLVSGTVSLDSALAGSVQPDETVFVFVRALEGGIPVAAMRLRAADLPASFGFKDVPLMADGPLPSQVVVAARLSRSGEAGARPGDLEGASAPVAPDASGIAVLIDRVRE